MVRTPESLGRYKLLRVLGKGAMGVVYEGRDPILNRAVAVKTILVGELDEATARDYSMRFGREAQAVARLNHPNIVQVYDFGEEGEIAYLVMEFVRGRELKAAFDAGEKFEIHEAVRLMCELLGALDFAHNEGVVHRDIKPANVMVDVEGHAKLADFGVARISDPDRQGATQVGTMVGTPAYMSPEQVQGHKIDRRTDIFSAGVILYQFLTGLKPFQGGGAFTIAKKIVQEDPPAPSSIVPTVPPEFDRVVARSLAKDPNRRYQSGREFADALQRVLDGQPSGDDNMLPVSGGTAPWSEAAPGPGASSGTEVELEFWRAIKDTDDPEELELYLQNFPNGVYVDLALRKMAQLRGTAGRAEDAAAERANLEAQERARLEAEAKARREALEKARKETEERVRREAAEKARLKAEEKARFEAEAKARREAQERARKEAEAQARAKREAEERARREAEEKARREAEERARREAEERARREAEERARRQAEDKARREAEERARFEAEAKAKREAAENARLEAEAKARREAEEKARREAEEKARRDAEERARLDAEAKAKREAEERAQREAEEKARREAEAIARAEREAAERARLEAEEKARSEAEEQARLDAETRARNEVCEAAMQEAERKALRAAEVAPRRLALEQERREAREQAQRDADERVRIVVESILRRQREQADLFRRAEAMLLDGAVSEAAKLLSKAADAGSGAAAKRLGEIYAAGAGDVAQDPAQAERWFAIAVALGESNPRADG